MAATDPDTFIPLGTSIAKLLLIATGQGTLAAAVGEGAGLLARLRGTLEIGGKRAALVEKIADDAAAQLLGEHQGISEADWHVAARLVASLIDRLSEKERLAAGYDWEELRRTLLALGGTDLRRNLDDESARQAFDWVLEVACQRVADCFTEKEALASILESVEEVRAGIQRLADRPAGASQTRAVVADHIEEVRHLAPDPLEDRGREIAELEAFARGSKDAWYAMEAGMVSGKTALMSSFALNPPDDVRVVSFFARRIGGEGNDWKSFAYYVGAQLAEILGEEYIERVSGPASQDAEFRLLLRRAAAACRSDKNPQPLVLLIDGVDEDSYYERPDDAAAKSILSLLPRHLPDGVKVITASRPNPQPPEDIICDASRVVAFLDPSIVAQKEINTRDIETFFKSDYAADIGAFIAACGGGLTVVELRQLVSRYRRLENVPTRKIESCVDHSPGRMLTSIKFVSGDREVTSYTLGHDAVLRSVLYEIAPHLVGECDGVEDVVWWAKIRDKALTPYREVVRKWVKDQADEGWGMVTPNYLLSDACFNLMLNHDVQVMLDPGRYNEIWRRFGRRALVLRMIDGECLEAMDVNLEGISEDVMTSLLRVAESRLELACMSAYVPGLCRLQVSHFEATPDVVLDMVLSVDGPSRRLNALAEVMEAALGCGRDCEFLPLLPVVLESLASCRGLSDKVLRLLVDVLTSVDCVVNISRGNGFQRFDLEGWVNEIQVYVNKVRPLLSLRSSFRDVDEVGEGVHLIASLCLAEDMAERIEDPWLRAQALTQLADALARAGEADRAWQVADEAVAMAVRIEEPWRRAQALAGVARTLARAGEADRARQVADEAVAMAERIEEPWLRAQALAGVAKTLAQAGHADEALAMAERIEEPRRRAQALTQLADALAQAGHADEALAMAERIEEPWLRAQALAGVAKTLAQAGETDRARQVADEALAMAERIEEPWLRAQALAGVAKTLAQAGETDRARQVADEALAMAERIEDPWRRAQALTQLADALAQAGHADEALAMAERIEEPRRRAQALTQLADALAQAGHADEALAMAERIEEPRRRAQALTQLADALAQAGHADEALAMAERIEEPRRRAQALAGVAKTLAQAGETDRARQVAENAASTAGRIEEPWRRAQALAGVAKTLAQAGETDRARQVADEAVAMAERIEEPRLRAQALMQLAETLAQAGETDRTRQVAENAASTAGRIEDPWLRAQALTQLADALAQAGHADEALAMAERIEEPWRRAQALTQLADALAQAGHADEALAMAERIEDPWLRAQALMQLAETLAQAGETDRARQVADEAVAMAVRIEDPWLRAQALTQLADALAQAGHADEALAMAERIEEPRLRAQALAQAGATDEALQIVSAINDPTSRSGALSPVIKALVRKGSSDDAVEAMHAELAWVRGVAERRDAAGCYATLAEACADVSDLVDSESTMRGQWLGLARSALACSWLYGESVWDQFGILMRVAPELAVRLVDERILADPEQGTAPESDPDLGYEGPGGEAGAYR